MAPLTTLLFVYGSLKAGYENAHEMNGATCVGPVRTAPGYRLIRFHDCYPALLRSLRPGFSGSVAGELYSVGAEQLQRLDAFEDCPELYQRGPVELEDGRWVQAYVVPSAAEDAWPPLDEY